MHTHPKSNYQIWLDVIENYKKGDAVKTNLLLSEFCDRVHPDVLEELFLQDVNQAMELFKLFVFTGLDCDEDGTNARDFFLRVVHYVVHNATPTIKQAMDKAFKETFPELAPAGFDENGKDLYSIDDLAQSLGVSTDDLLKEAEKMPGVEVRPTEIPKDVTFH